MNSINNEVTSRITSKPEFEIFCADKRLAQVSCTELGYQIMEEPSAGLTSAEMYMLQEIKAVGFQDWVTSRGLPQTHRDYASMLGYYKIVPSPDARFFLSLAMDCINCDDRITVRKIV